MNVSIDEYLENIRIDKKQIVKIEVCRKEIINR